jgi:hypothetical protein
VGLTNVLRSVAATSTPARPSRRAGVIVIGPNSGVNLSAFAQQVANHAANERRIAARHDWSFWRGLGHVSADRQAAVRSQRFRGSLAQVNGLAIDGHLAGLEAVDVQQRADHLRHLPNRNRLCR